MEKPDTSPLRTSSGAIVVDQIQKDLDFARAVHRKQYDKGYLLSQKGQDVEAQRILDRANEHLGIAEERYAAARTRGGRTT